MKIGGPSTIIFPLQNVFPPSCPISWKIGIKIVLYWREFTALDFGFNRDMKESFFLIGLNSGPGVAYGSLRVALFPT
jgi:hypothetical protein